MFKVYGRKRIILWLKVFKRNRASPTSEPKTVSKKQCGETSGTNYQGHLNSLSEVEVVIGKLDEKHEDGYTPEQIRAWAYMINMKKHTSYDDPPSKPFFRGSGSKNKDKEKSESATGTSVARVSPGKRIMYRSECINELDKC